jgi:hypothetical protein
MKYNVSFKTMDCFIIINSVTREIQFTKIFDEQVRQKIFEGSKLVPFHIHDNIYGYVDEDMKCPYKWLCGFILNGDEYYGNVLVSKAGHDKLTSDERDRFIEYLSGTDFRWLP